MAGGSIGYATLPVVPSFRGFGGGLAKQIAAPIRTAGVAAGAAGGQATGGGFARGFGRALTGVGKAAVGVVGVGLAAGIGATGILAGTAFSKGLDRAISIQNAQAKLTGLGHSTQAVEKIMNNALASVKGTAFGLGDAAGVAAGAVAAGIKPGNELTRVLRLTADAATIAGTDMSSMGSVFNKVAASGKLQGDVIAQLQDAGVPVLQFVAKQIGKTAAETAKLASDGKIDFQTFSDAMEAGLGGAALASGKTAQGAFANVQAALGRIGAGFLSGPVANAPVLFTAFGGAVDRLGVSLKPVMAEFDVFSGTQMTALAKRIDGIQFDGIVTKARTMTAGVVAALKTVATGQGFSFDLTRAFGLDKAPIVWQIANKTHDVLAGALDVAKILGGDSSNGTAADLAKRFGLDKAPAIYAVATGVHDAIAGMLKGFSGSNEAASIGKSLSGLAPAFQSFSSQLPNITGAAVKLSGAGLTLLSSALGFLADHVDTIIQFMPLIVAGFVAWQVASRATTAANMALRTAELAALPVQIQRNGLRLAAALLEYRVAAAQRASAAATATNTTATGANTAATSGGILANVRNGVAMVASRVAMVAGAVATGVATAAQWAWNAAMSANPIALVVLAIAALVAGIIWFFTQTKLGQAIWSGFISWLQSAWTAVSSFFTVLWAGITAGVSAAWTGIVGWVTGAINNVQAFIAAGIATIRGVWSAGWSVISSVARAVWSAIVGFIMSYISNVKTTIAIGIAYVRGVWSVGWGMISSVARGILSAIVGFVSSGLNSVRSVVSGVVNTIRGVWSAGWSVVSSAVRSAVSLVLSIVRGMVSGVSGAINNVVSVFRGIQSKVLGALAGAGSWLLSVGRNVIQGFVNGARSMAGSILSAVTAPIKDAIAGAKNLLGIHSPSRVFRQIGDYVGQGLAQGLKGSAKGVTDAARKMSNAVGTAFEAHQLKEGAAHNTYLAINAGTRVLQNLATQRDKIADRLTAANKKLAAAQKSYNDFKTSAAQSVGGFDVTKAQTGTGIVTALQTQLADVKKFTSIMTQLRKKGLDATSYKQFIAAGVDALPLATNLLAGGSKQIKQVSTLQGQLAKASGSFATSAANDLYGAGVNAAKGLVKGLQSQNAAIAQQMQKIAGSMVSAVKRALGIHSPSRVMYGLGINTGQGYLNALTAMIRPARDAVTRMVSAKGVDTPTLELASVVDYSAAVDRIAAARAATTAPTAASSAGTGVEVTFTGDVGMSPEKLVQEMIDRVSQSQQLASFDLTEVLS